MSVPLVKVLNTILYYSSVSSFVLSVEFLYKVNRSFSGKLSRACSSVESRAMLQAQVRFSGIVSDSIRSVRFSSVQFVVQLSTKLLGAKRMMIVQVL